MAQVKIKKLQQGGTLTVNGEQYTLAEVNDALAMLSPEEQQYMAGVSRALSAGNSWTGNSFDNSFSGTGVDDWMSSIYGSKERADKKLNKKSHLTKTFDATVNNRRDTLRRAASRFFLNLRHTPQLNDTTSSSNTEDSELPELLRGSGWFDTDGNGKYVEGPSNAGRMKIYDDIVSHFLSPEEDRKKKKHDTWGSNYDDILNWISGNPDASNYFGKLKNKILSGGRDLDDLDLDTLRLFGFDPDRGQKIGDPEAAKNFKTKFGISDDDFNKYFGIDNNGNILPRQDLFSSLGVDINGNYWFNDAFRQSKGWNNALLPWLKDLWWVNGKLYKGGDQELLNQLNIMNFQNKNKIGDYTGADNLVKWLWGQTTPMSYDRATYSNFLNDLNGRYFNQRYYVPGQDDDFTNIVKYYDFNDDVDQYGLRKARYAVLDQLGNASPIELDENSIAALQPYLDEDGNPLALDLYNRGSANKKDDIYYNTYVKRIGDDITAYINPSDEGYVVLDLPRSGTNANSITRNLGEDESIKIPYHIWQLFGDNDRFWNKLAKNDGLREKFYNTMEILLGDVYSGDYGQNLLGNSANVLNEKQWQELGLTKEQSETLYDEIKKINPNVSGNWFGSMAGGWWRSVIPGVKVVSNKRQGAAEARHEQNTVRRLQSNKLGGWLPKMQEGGSFGGGTNVERKEKEPVKITKYEDSTKSKDIFDSNDHWTSSDSLDLASTLVDLGSLAATFAPGVGNIAGAVGGAAADLMRFSSNVSRDGMDVGDWGNLAVGLGMDAVTLLPIVGTGAKAAKLMKTLTKVSKPLSKIFLAIGATEAATALGHLVTTGEFTVEDFRKVAMGAQAAMGHFHIKRAAHAEADLANAINKIIKTEGQNAENIIKIANKEVSVDDTIFKEFNDLKNSVVGKKTKDAEASLKEYLKKVASHGVKSKEELDVANKEIDALKSDELLKAFGLKENKGVLSLFSKKISNIKEKKIGEGDISGRRLSWGEPKHKWNNGEVQTADEFIDAQLANPEIRKRLAAQGWFRNVSSPGSRQDASRINYLAARLAQIAPANDFSTSVGNARVYKGRQAYADWNPEKPIAPIEPTPTPERGIIGLLPPAPQSVVEPESVIPNLPIRVQPSGTPVRISPEPIAPGRSRIIKTQYNAPATGTIVTPFRQVRPNRMLPGRPYPTVPTLGKEQRGMVSLNPDNFAEVLQSIVYTPRFRQLVKVNPAAARQLFDKMKFNYVMHGTNGTPLTRGQEFDEMSEALKAFNGLYFKKGGKIVKGDEGVDIGRAGKGIPFNRADAEDASRLFLGLAGNKRVFDELKAGNRARLLQQMYAPRAIAPRIYTGRERYIADQSAGNIMSSMLPDVTSDSKLAMSARLQQNAQAENMRQQGRLAESEAITKQNEVDANVANQNAQMEAELANRRSQLLADIESKERQLNAQKIETDFVKNILPFKQQRDQQIRTEMNERDALFKQKERMQAIRGAQDDMEKAALANRRAFEMFKNSNDYKSGYVSNTDYMRWLSQYQPDYFKYLRDRSYGKFHIYDLDYQIGLNNQRYWGTNLINPKPAE